MPHVTARVECVVVRLTYDGNVIKLIGRPRTPIKDRLLAKVVEQPCPRTHDVLGRPIVGPCWIFTGQQSHNGYGMIWDSDKGTKGGNRPAHRVAYEIYRGPILNEEPDHLCRVRSCVSPWHIEDVTKAINAQRREHRGPWSECKQGHAFTPENTRIEPRKNGPAQICKTCDNERRRRRHRAKVGLPLDMPIRGVVDHDACPSGHPWAVYAEWPNVKGRRQRRCSECRRINVRRWQAKRRVERAAAR